MNRHAAMCLALIVSACSAARIVDTAHSITGEPPTDAYSERDYQAFVARWLGQIPATRESPPYGAFAQYVIQIQPPNRPGYNRVGGKELDDALNVFSNWCRTQGGKPVRYFNQYGPERMAKFLQKPVTQIRDGYFLACEQDSVTVAVIDVGVDSSTKDRPANLAVTHYTSQSVAQAQATEAERRASIQQRQKEQAAVTAERARQQKLAEDELALKRNLDARRRFEEASKLTVKIGDSVCTYDTNAYGSVEQIEKERIKVHVIGEAVGDPGYFFKDGSRVELTYQKVEAPRWFDRSRLAGCRFQGERAAQATTGPAPKADVVRTGAPAGPSRAQIQSALHELRQVEPMFMVNKLNVDGCYVSTDKGELNLGALHFSSLDSASCNRVVDMFTVCTLELQNGLQQPLRINYEKQGAAQRLVELLRSVALSCGAQPR